MSKASKSITQPAPHRVEATDPASSPERMYSRLRAAYPDAHCELAHLGPFQLLVATVLSAQSTDVGVNRVTPELFRQWPNAAAMSQAELPKLEQVIGSLGMYRQKARHLVGLSKEIVERHSGEVPKNLDDLVRMPGVGRKTANVVLGVAFGCPEGVVVDTHVQRLAQRLGWTRADQPLAIEQDLMRLFARQDWDLLSHTLIFHGRRCCTARSPACAACPVADACPSAHRAQTVGRKTQPVSKESRASRPQSSHRGSAAKPKTPQAATVKTKTPPGKTPQGAAVKTPQGVTVKAKTPPGASARSKTPQGATAKTARRSARA